MDILNLLLSFISLASLSTSHQLSPMDTLTTEFSYYSTLGALETKNHVHLLRISQKNHHHLFACHSVELHKFNTHCISLESINNYSNEFRFQKYIQDTKKRWIFTISGSTQDQKTENLITVSESWSYSLDIPDSISYLKTHTLTRPKSSPEIQTERLTYIKVSTHANQHPQL